MARSMLREGRGDRRVLSRMNLDITIKKGLCRCICIKKGEVLIMHLAFKNLLKTCFFFIFLCRDLVYVLVLVNDSKWRSS